MSFQLRAFFLPILVLLISSVLVMPAAADVISSVAPDVNVAARADAGARVAAGSGSTLQMVTLKTQNVYAVAPYRISDSATATGIDTPLIDVPQTIQAIPAKVLHDQAAQSVEDAVRNAPGVYVQQGEGNRDELYIRGVKTKSDFFSDGLRDDTEYFRDLYNVAHLDVLQGPAAILFGRGGAGGVVNLVTKQPQRERIRNFSIETGSYGHLRGTFDVGDTIGTSGAFRVLGMSEDSGSFRDHYFLRRHAINPKFRVQLGDRTQLDVGASYLKDRRLADRGIPSRNGRPVDVPRNTFFGSVDQNRAQSRVEAFNVRIKHQVNDNLEVRNAFRVTDNKRFYVNAYPAAPVDDQDELKFEAYDHPGNRLSYIDRAELVARFSTGVLEHKLLAGSEFSWQRGNDMETLPAPDSKSLPGTYSLSDPTVQPQAFPYLDRKNHVVGKEFGVYAEDQMSWGAHWMALLGARWDRFSVDANYLKPGVTPDHTNNLDTEWSPRAGLIYKPVANDSIYASVTQTYTPQGANIALSRKSPAGANLAPEKATNYEIGNKLELFDGNLSFTAALFQLELNNVVSNAADGSGRLVNTGSQRNRGIELSVEGNITDKWSVYANYAHLDAKITKATTDAEAGDRVGLVPLDQSSVWTRYALSSHWGFGAGVRGESQKYTSYDNNVVLPGYVVGNLMAYYQTHNYRVQVNVDNVTNRKYFPTASGDNQIMPGTPRSLTVNLTMKF